MTATPSISRRLTGLLPFIIRFNCARGTRTFQTGFSANRRTTARLRYWTANESKQTGVWGRHTCFTPDWADGLALNSPATVAPVLVTGRG